VPDGRRTADIVHLPEAEHELGDARLDKRPEVQAEIWNLERDGAFDLFKAWYLANAAIPDSRLEDFYRGNQDRRIKQGMGLGLSIARDLAQAHGGRITLNSTPGLGSEFTVNIPKGRMSD